MGRRFKLTRRPGRRPAPPLNAEFEYRRKILTMLAYARALVEARLMPRLDRWLLERDDHTDAAPRSKQVNVLIDQMRDALASKFPPDRLERAVENTAESVSLHQRREMSAQVAVELPPKADRGLGEVIDSFTHENVALIRTVPEQYLADVQRTVLAGLSAGSRHEDISRALVARANVAENRAGLIARDQTLKLNGRLTEVRQTNLGVTRYVWHTVGDQRVRDAHAERDGEVYEWADPPGDPDDPATGGHPGTAINCRCWAEGLLDDEPATEGPEDTPTPEGTPDPGEAESPRFPPWDPRSPLHEEWLSQRRGGT